ncbi:M20/M25/M40 family metallo-hydrolase [Psychrobacillus sp. FSL K6-2843]|uniref:M20/M25/M40 family metallo-hydrolase n=1 Tax=Psychrobacillus sp. FSL K6-2843 TaxID=2921549 RepID=UPI0012B0ECE6|nr:M20/M25/M40 family metallo-hydrolase [Bacillus sp. N3536]
MVNNQLFKKLSDESQLGEIIGVPVSISGGLLHKTYAIETDKGKYAVKILNPQIMLRPDAMMNYINSERVANLVSKKVPAVPAKIIYGNFIQTIDSQFYIVFDWIESITLESSVINSSHSEKIGSILADIHGTDFSELQLKKDLGNNEQSVNWKYYIQQGQKSNAEWVESLLEIVDKLYEWSTLAYKANRVLSTNLVISHRTRDHLCKRIPEMIDHVVKAWRGEYSLIEFHTPTTFNNPEFVEEIMPTLEKVMGLENIIENGVMSGSEDFSYISQSVQSAFLILGTGKEGEAPVHNPRMQQKEEIFKYGASLHANVAIEWLKQQHK